ncbi:MAG: carboxylating nicotinate-nucleotide diphosphorylase, partial [Candidatus Kariarchaeaceae archaeon]
NECVRDGDLIKKGDVILQLKGKPSNILQAERLALNILSHMSGISTTTSKLVGIVKSRNSMSKVTATRKTIPGIRKYQKWAVKVGGGDTHRMSLSSMILIKENHIASYGGISNAIESIRKKISFSTKLEIEVRIDEEAIQAASAGVDVIMLDNYKPKQIQNILPRLRDINSKLIVEASGNINIENIVAYADTNVDIISLGEITHSVKAFDMTLIFDNLLKRD